MRRAVAASVPVVEAGSRGAVCLLTGRLGVVVVRVAFGLVEGDSVVAKLLLLLGVLPVVHFVPALGALRSDFGEEALEAAALYFRDALPVARELGVLAGLVRGEDLVPAAVDLGGFLLGHALVGSHRA